MARRLQNRLALAQFKTKRGWEDLTLDTIEPKLEEELRRKRLSEGDLLSDSSSSTSDLPIPTRALMSSPLKAPFFSDAIGSSNGSTGHRKRTYMASFDYVASSPSKRYRGSPTAYKSFASGHAAWKDSHQLAQSSPLKPRRQQHFTTSTGPNVSFFGGSRQMAAGGLLTSPNYAAPSDDDEDLLPAHSFQPRVARSSPPSTPPMRGRRYVERQDQTGRGQGASTGEEGADLLLYLAASPSPAMKTRMEPPSTPPPRNKMALPSSMMTTPGGGNPFQSTPGMPFDFSDFVHMTPSPAQKTWKTPNALAGAKTPLGMARKHLTFDDLP